MTEQNVSIEEVRALVAERQRFDDWIQALEARRSETPVRVFERVYGDYQSRRAEVMSKLHTHFDGLSELSTQLDQRLAALESSLGALEDERAEAMLRTAVGEFDDERWEEVRNKVEERISSLGVEREALITEVDEVRTLLASARSDSEQSGSAASESVELETGAESPVVSEESELDVIAPVTPFEPTDAIDLHPLVDAEISIVAEIPPRQPTPTEAAEPVGAAPVDLPEVDYEDALALFAEPSKSADADAEFLKSLDGIESEFDTAEPSVPVIPSADASRSTVPRVESTTEADPFDDLAFLRSVIEPESGIASGTAAPAGSSAASATGGPQKTLRCTECGTMNLPTEWYCERCGGELAAF